MTPPPPTTSSSSSMENIEPAVLPAGKAEDSTLPFKGIKDVLLGDGIPISAGLRRVLVDLELAGAPVCVYEKTLTNADRSVGQNRFLVPCKKPAMASFPFTKIFTRDEMAKVCEDEEDKDGGERKKKKRPRKESNGAAAEKKTKYGLDVQAYDGEGRSYHVMCRYLGCNGAYRIKDLGWKGFLATNGLLVRDGVKARRKNPTSSEEAAAAEIRRDAEERRRSAGDEPVDAARQDNVRMELWAFRSLRLPVGLTDQHDGALGLIFRHYRADQAAAAAPEDDGMKITSPEKKSEETTPGVHETAVDDAPEVDAAAAPVGCFTPMEMQVLQVLASLLLSRSAGTGDDGKGHGY